MKKIAKIIVVVLIMAFIFLTIMIKNSQSLAMDSFVYDQLIYLKRYGLTPIIKVITNFGGTYFLTFLTILSIIVFKKKIYSILITTNILMIALLNQIMKIVIQRPRPNVTHLVIENGFSYPSGHAMASFAFYGLLIFLLNKSNIDKKIKKILTIFLSIVIFLIGMSRIYLGVHYFSDILAGFMVSTIYLLLFTNCTKKYLKSE